MNDVVTIIYADTYGAFRETWFVMPNWKWMGLGLALTIGFFLIQALRPLVSPILKSFRSTEERKHNFIYYFLGQQIEKPLSWILVCFFWMAAWQVLELPDFLGKTMHVFTQLCLSIACIKLAYMGAQALGLQLELFVKKTENTLDDQLAPFATKTLKVLIVILGFLVVLQNFGVNVTSLLAGLGIGGIALAFAAQDTVANIFGSITIILDRPFQVGDLIRVADTEGTVEEVGFRSTRIRTIYQSLVSVPNSVMAKEKIDNLGVRPRRRIRLTWGFSYDSSQEQLKNFCTRMSSTLRQIREIDSQDVSVYFSALGDFSMNVTMTCFVKTQDIAVENQTQELVLFEAVKLASELGLSFAFPTQTLHLKNAAEPS